VGKRLEQSSIKSQDGKETRAHGFLQPRLNGVPADGSSYVPRHKGDRLYQSNVIPIRLPHDHKPLAEQFQIKWTPALVTLDTDGKEHHRTVGFLSPEELIPSLLLGKAKIDFDHEDFAKALVTLEDLLKDYPKSAAAPEAIFLRGVCGTRARTIPKLSRRYTRNWQRITRTASGQKGHLLTG